MPILHLPGEMTPGTIGADEARFFEVDGGGNADHVDHRNAFGDADDERHFGVGGFENGVGGVRRRNENHARVGAGGFYGFADGVEDGAFEMLRAAFAGRNAADDVGAVLESSAARGTCLRGR